MGNSLAPTDPEYVATLLAAWGGNLPFPELLCIASQLEQSRQGPLVAVLYQTWLQRNVSPYVHAAHFNLGATLFSLGDYQASENAYRRAIQIAPHFLQPRLNLGLNLERQGRFDEAIAEWRYVAECFSPDQAENRPFVLMALNHLGRVLEQRKQFQEALDQLTRCLEIEPNQPDTIHHWVWLREKLCAWPIYAEIPGMDPELLTRSTSALAMLNISDDPYAQLTAARHYVEAKLESNVPRLASANGYGHEKIRIAYCSSDFCLHPVALLTAELFELHDRSRFEVFGYCWSREDGSATRQRVVGAMDHFFRIDQLSDEAAAQLIRGHEIDILIDLQGQTLGARANMLAYRPAPIQITYLGLPATTGLPSIDYVIADRFLIPEAEAGYYSETPLYMPDVYQVSDRQRVSGPKPARAECGLPQDGFVFCSFNNNFKFTPDVFAVWMRILHRVPGSVLWLLADNPWAQENLRREAEQRGIASDRLIFAPRVSPENYLARYEVADLFLDTFPFNAGTTANDALWIGLPVLTCAGRSFASRMAGALLTAAGMQQLITTNLQDYEELAVRLAGSPDECRQLREHLAAERQGGALFDTPRFVRNLESHLTALVADLAGRSSVD